MMIITKDMHCEFALNLVKKANVCIQAHLSKIRSILSKDRNMGTWTSKRNLKKNIKM